MLATLGLTNAAFGQTPALVDFGGLLQRITVTIGFAWPTALTLHALTAMPTRVATQRYAGRRLPSRTSALA